MKSETRELRKFGLLVGGVFALIALAPIVLHGRPLRVWAAVPAGLLLVLGALWPALLKYPQRGWMLVGHVLGWVNTRVLLSVVYYAAITPLAFVMRGLGRDPLDRRLGDRASYWVERPRGGVRGREEMERSF